MKTFLPTACIGAVCLLAVGCGGGGEDDVSATFQFADGSAIAYSGSVELEISGGTCYCTGSTDGDGLGITYSWLVEPLPSGDDQSSLSARVGGDVYSVGINQIGVNGTAEGLDITFEISSPPAPPGSRPLSRTLEAVTNGAMLCRRGGDVAACFD